MKKILLAAFALMVSTGAFAQLDWGVKAGLNLATLTNSNIQDGDAKMKPSIYAGVFAEFPLNYWLSIQPEVIYSRQGTRYKDGDQKIWNRLNYLNVPLMFKFYVIEDLSLGLGPQFGFLINSRQRIKGYGDAIDGTHDLDNIKGFDVSFGMGLGYKITRHLDCAARYNLGFTKVNDTDGDKVKNSVLQLGFGYRF